jgi:hypothetical protein
MSEAVTIFDLYLGGSPTSTVEDRGLLPECSTALSGVRIETLRLADPSSKES